METLVLQVAILLCKIPIFMIFLDTNVKGHDLGLIVEGRMISRVI
jgi:hypothetical protein